MAIEIGALRALLSLDSAAFDRGAKRAQASMSNLQRSLTRASETMRRTGRRLTTRMTLPLAGFGALTLKTAGDFQAAMNQVAAVSSATGEEFQALREQAKELGATTQFSASEAAEAMGFLAMAGMEANDILAAMPDTLQLASAAQLDMASAADIVTNILAGYGKEVGELGHVTDVLVKAFTSANTDLRGLAEAMKYAGPVASAAGVQFEEAAAAIGMMGNAGIQGSMAGTSLRGAITKMLNPTKSATAILEEMGETLEDVDLSEFESEMADVAAIMESSGLSFTDAEGRLRPLADIIEDLEPHADKIGDTMTIFGQRAGPAMAALVSQGADALRDLTGELEESGGTAERVSAVQMEGFNGAMRELKSAFEGLQIAIADSGLLDFVTGMVKAVSKWVQEVSRSSPQLLKWGAIIAGLAAAIGPALLALGSMAVVAAALASPIGLVVLGLGAAAGAAALVATYWDDLTDRFPILGTGLEKLKGVFSAVWEGIKGIVQGAAEMVGGALDTIAGLLTGDLTLALDGMKAVWEGWERVAWSAITAVIDAFEAIVPGFRQAAADIIDAVKDLPAKLKQWGIEMVQGFVDGIIETWNSLKASVTSIFWQAGADGDARAAGERIGRNLAEGMGQGVELQRPAVRGHITDMMQDMEDTARDEAETRSPSRVWMRIGHDLMGGLAVGIQEGADAAAQAAAEAADRVSTGFTVPATAEFNTLGSEISSSLSSAFKSGLDGATSFSDAMMSIMTRMRDRLIDQVFDQITNAIEQMFSGSGGGVLGSILGAFGGGLKIGGPAPAGLTPFASSMPKIPGFASGGVASGWAMVGERGRELVHLGQPSRVYSNAETNRMMGGGGVHVEEHIHNYGGSEVTTNTRDMGDGRIFREVIIGTLNEDIANRGPVSRNIEGAWGLKRGGVG